MKIKVLIVVDKLTSAIGRLALMTQKYCGEGVEVIPIHPKRESEDNFNRFQVLAENADIIDFAYFRSMQVCLERYPQFINKPKILTHYNPYSINTDDWNKYKINKIIACNKSISKNLTELGYENEYINLAVDFNEYDWSEFRDYDNKEVLMVAARIESKKGILEVAKVCKELGYKFKLVGSISKPEYFKELLDYGVYYYQDISNEDLKDIYKHSGVLVINSIENFESGTLPQLEAMAMGLPVLSREGIGHTPDLYGDDNMVVRYGGYDDLEDLKNELKTLNEDSERKRKMSISAYKTVMYYGAEARAEKYKKLYRDILHPRELLVSVIIPTIPEREDDLKKIINAYENQTYKNIEIIPMVDNKKGYNLARMRNKGAIKACGDILIFNDDRLLPEKDAVDKFVTNLIQKKWLFGNKDNAKKKNFVENFSCIYRQDLINAGMFNERITAYGGMSQELRERFKTQGFEFIFIDDAKAKTLRRSSSITKRLKDIKRMKIKLAKMGMR